MANFPQKLPITLILPFDTACFSKFLRDQLKGYSFLLKALIQAIDYLQKKEFDRFDPLVGDAACQVRALKIYSIAATSVESYSILLPTIINFLKKTEGLLADTKTLERGVLQEFLIERNLLLGLSQSELFIFDSYLLTLTKEIHLPKIEMPLCANEKVNPLLIRSIDPTRSREFCSNLVDKMRRRIALASVEYMREESRNIPNCEIASKMVSSEFTILHNQLQCIPCFWTSLIVTKRALQLQIPVILIAEQKAKDQNNRIIDKVVLLFHSDGERYRIVDPEERDVTQKWGIVIKGATCKDFAELSNRDTWIQELAQHQPTELFLAYSATHRQYPDSSKDHLVTEKKDPTFLAFREKSIRLGCCLENPSLFFTYHVYCQKISNIPEMIYQSARNKLTATRGAVSSLST